MSCLYILEINPLSDASLANIFSHLWGLYFHLFMVSFAPQKLFKLNYFLFLLFLFLFSLHYERSQKDLAEIYTRPSACFHLRVL